MSMENEPTHAYMGARPCGCACALLVDNPEHKREVAKDVASWIRSGLTIQRGTIEEARQFWKDKFASCPECAARHKRACERDKKKAAH